MHGFFNPSRIAIIGARSTPGFGFHLPISLKKYGHGDDLSLVNNKGGELHGYPLYKSIKDVPRPVDMAIIITPAPAVPGILLEIAEAGITNVILESAGFSETGEEGKALQEKCRAIALEKGLKVMGPNCVGVVNSQNRFATGEVIEEALTPGNIGLVAQSGIFGTIMLDQFPDRGLAISRAVTLGNRLIIDESDALDYFREDESTDVVLMYIEGAADGAKLRKSLASITPVKPVIILKSGRTAEGVAATGSHTGSMAGSDDIYDGLFAQTGAIRVAGVAEMLDLATIFSQQPLPKGDRVCIITSSGSLGAVSIDRIVEEGLTPASLSEETVKGLREKAPAWMNVKNPLDVGPSEMFGKAFEAVIGYGGVDMVLFFPVIPYSVIRTFSAIGLNAESWLGPLGEMSSKYPSKPVVAGIVGHREWTEQLREVCGERVSMIDYPENAAHAIAALAKYARYKKSVNK